VRTARLYLAGIFGLALVIRLAFFLAAEPWDLSVQQHLLLRYDPKEYHALAVDLLHSGTLGLEGEDGTLRTPLYPLFVAAHYAVFGPRPWIVLLTQILLDGASCVLLFLLLRRLLEFRVAALATLLLALNPTFIFHANTLYSDNLCAFLCLAGGYALARAIQYDFARGAGPALLAAGVLFGLAALTKPVVQYLPALVVLYLVIVLRGRRFRRALGLGAVFSVAFMATLSPWLARNYAQFSAVSLSTSGALNLLILYVNPMEMDRRDLPYRAVETALLREADSLMIRDGLDPERAHGFQKARYWKWLARDYMARYPAAFVTHYAAGIFRSFFNPGTRGYAEMLGSAARQGFDMRSYPHPGELFKQWLMTKSNTEIALGGLIGTYLMVVYSGLAVGLFTAWKRYRRPFLVFCLALAAYLILITGTAGQARFMMPAMPFYLAFSAAGFVWLRDRRRSARRGHSPGAGDLPPVEWTALAARIEEKETI